MSVTSICTLAGWSFLPSILNPIVPQHMDLIGLDYHTGTSSELYTMADELAACIPSSSALLAWSLGGLVAIALADRHPDKVKQLFLISSQPKFTADAQWAGIEPVDVNRFNMQFRNNHILQLHQFNRLIQYPNRIGDELRTHQIMSDTQRLKELLKLLFHTDVRSIYQGLTIPITHFINCDDKIIQQNPRHLTNLNPTINIVSIEKSGHAGFLAHSNLYQQTLLEQLC